MGNCVPLLLPSPDLVSPDQLSTSAPSPPESKEKENKNAVKDQNQPCPNRRKNFYDQHSCASSTDSNTVVGFFPIPRWLKKLNRIQPAFLQEIQNQISISSSSSMKLPPALYEIVIDGKTHRSVVSDITMDENFANTSNHFVMAYSRSMSSSKLTSDFSRPPKLTIENSFDEEVEHAALTKQMLVSYLQNVNDNPNVSILLNQLNELEAERIKTPKCTTPKTAKRQSLTRQSMLESIRETFKKELVSPATTPHIY